MTITTCQTCPTCHQPITGAAAPTARPSKTRGPVFLSPEEIRALSREDLYSYRKRTAAHDDAAAYLQHLAAVDTAGGTRADRTEAARVATALLADLKGRASRPSDRATLYALKLQTRPDPTRPFRFVLDRIAADAAHCEALADALRDETAENEVDARDRYLADAARLHDDARTLAARYGLAA